MIIIVLDIVFPPVGMGILKNKQVNRLHSLISVSIYPILANENVNEE